MSPTCRTIRMHVDPGGWHGIGATRHDPSAAVESVTISLVIARDEIHYHQILRVGVQAEQTTLSITKPSYMYVIASANDGFWRICRVSRIILTWNVGNILRPAFVTIISVPSWWNSSQSGFASRATPAPSNAGWSGRFAPAPALDSSAEDPPSSLGWWSPWWLLLLLLSLRDSTVADGEIGFAEFVEWIGKTVFIGWLGLRDLFTLPALCKQAGKTIKDAHRLNTRKRHLFSLSQLVISTMLSLYEKM